MKKALFLILLSMGCQKKNSIVESPHAHQFFVLACCKDANNNWPENVPQSQIGLCNKAENHCLTDDCQIDGDSYLPTQVDCARPYKVGFQYY